MTADLLDGLEGPADADLEYERGYDDGIAGNPKSGTSQDYLDGYYEGKAVAEEDYDDFYDWFDDDEEW